MSGKHGPNSWHDYLEVHRSRLADFADHFIIEDRLTSTRTRSQVVWKGELLCADGIEIHVTKTRRSRTAAASRGSRPLTTRTTSSGGTAKCRRTSSGTTTQPTIGTPIHIIVTATTPTVRRSCRPSTSVKPAGQRSVRSSRRRMRCGDRVAEGRGKGGFKSGRSAKTDYDGYCP